MTASPDCGVIVETRERIGIITLHNPAKKNALSRTLLKGLIAALADFQAQSISVVIIRAESGARIWSAGHDITELPLRADPLGFDDPLEEALRAIQSFPGPVVAMVAGSVWGGACDLAITCDMIIGDETASFAITPVKLGLPYNASGCLHFINRVGINIAKEMFFTAEPVPALRAREVGILNHLVPAGELEGFVMDLAAKMAANSALSISVIKEQIRLLSEAHPVSPQSFERIQGMRRRVYFSHDYAEGIKAFLEKRQPAFRGD